MRQLVTFAMVLMLIGAAGGLYMMKHRVDTRRAAVAALERQILADGEALRVLEAEKAYLASPQALQARTVRYLRLAPIGAEQILGSPASLPYRIERFSVAALPNGDVRYLPEPRLKPAAPQQMPVAIGAVSRTLAPPTARTIRMTPPPNADFISRIERALDRAGDQR